MGRAIVETPPARGRPERATDRAEDARLVGALRAGDEAAFGQLYDRWFDRVFDLCRHIVRDPEIARETTQDAFLAAWRGVGELRDPASFGGWLLRIARNKALNRFEHERRSQSVDDMSTVLTVAPTTGPSGFTAEDRVGAATEPEKVAEDAELVALVDEAAAALGPRDATVLDLQLRYGLEPSELAGALGVSHNAAKQVVHRVRRRLGEAIKARVLWRGGSPRCDALRDVLSDGGLVTFGAEAARAINRHAAGCADCAQRQQARLSPAALFSAVPVGVAPVLLKQKTALALEAADVPMAGSQAIAGGVGSGAGLGRRLLRVAVPSGVAVTIVGVVTLLAAATVGELDGDDVTAPGTSSSRVTSTTMAVGGATNPELAPGETAPPSSSTTTTRPAGAPVPLEEPALIPGSPPPEPPPPPPPPPPSIISFGISPAFAPPGYPMTNAPVVSWSVSGGAGSVSVSGPGISSGAFSGSQAVCPGVESAGWCRPDIGSHEYTLLVFNSAGTVVDQRTGTLTTQ